MPAPMKSKEEITKRMDEAERRRAAIQKQKEEMIAAKEDMETLKKQSTKDKKDSMEDTHDLVETIGNLEAKQLDDMRMVRGTFIYKRGAKQWTGICRKWRGEEAKFETFVDGHEYTIPLYKARWLNGDETEQGCADIEHTYRVDNPNVGAYNLGKAQPHELPEGQAKIQTEKHRKPIFQFFITEYL